jgi:uncharacterized cupredoxin-like copper-binding protein
MDLARRGVMELQGSRPLLFGLAVLVLAVPWVGSAVAQDGSTPADEPAEVTVNVYLGAGEDTTFDIHPSEITVGPDTRVTFNVTNLQPTEHDFGLMDTDVFEVVDEEDLREGEGGQGELVKTPLLGSGENYELTVIIPEETQTSVTYICSVSGHQDLGMEGTLQIGAAGGGDEGGEEEVVDFGVDYLAYWVGVVSFVILFVVLVGTFFVFRYSTTGHAADHRTGGPETVTVAAGAAEGEPQQIVEPLLPSPRSVATVLAVLALIGAAFYYFLV